MIEQVVESGVTQLIGAKELVAAFTDIHQVVLASISSLVRDGIAPDLLTDSY